MPHAERNGSELVDFKVIQARENKRVQLYAVSATKIQQITEAVNKQSEEAVIKLINDRFDKETELHNTKIDFIKSERSAAIQALRNQNATKEDIDAAEQKYQKKLNAENADYQKKRKQRDKEINAQRAKDEQRINQIAAIAAKNEYKQATAYDKQRINQRIQAQHQAFQQEQKNHLVNLGAEKTLLEKELKKAKTAEERAEIQKKINAINREETQTLKLIEKSSKEEEKVKQRQADLSKKIRENEVDRVKQSGKGADKLLEKYQQIANEAQSTIDDLDAEIEVNKKFGIDTTELEKTRAGLQETLDSGLLTDIEELKKLERLQKRAEKRDSAKAKEEAKNQIESLKDEAADITHAAEVGQAKVGAVLTDPEARKAAESKALTEALGKLTAQMAAAIDTNIDTYYQYAAKIDARLQGVQGWFKDYDDIMNRATTKLMFVGVTRMETFINKLSELADAGVAYNIEGRAFLASISENIATTFDVFNKELLRLIRIQQADTTAARLGMEASLTKLFNNYFSDTSYLTDVADTVSGAILDASAQLTRDASAEFEFITQKWLGALYSLGLSQEAVSSIAQGLNYLGTGDVEALNSNDTVRTLFAMAAANSGISFADILTGGLDADITNDLLRSMVEYLRSIATNTDNNQVTKAAYTDIFGISMSDLVAISNLTDKDINNLYSETMSYNSMMLQTQEQLLATVGRVPLAVQLKNVMDNLLMSSAIGIADNPALYGIWKSSGIIAQVLGGGDAETALPIPFVNAAGFGLDLNTSVIALLQSGLAGLGLLSTLLEGTFKSGGQNLLGGLLLPAWNYREYNTRGSAMKGISSGTASGTSQSSSLSNTIINTSSEDIENTTLSDATDDAMEKSKITNKDLQSGTDIYTKIYEDLHSLWEWANPEGTEKGLKVMGIGAGSAEEQPTEGEEVPSTTPEGTAPEPETPPTETAPTPPTGGSSEPSGGSATVQTPTGGSNTPGVTPPESNILATEIIVDSLTAGYLMLKSSNTSLEHLINKDSEVTSILDLLYNNWMSTAESISQNSQHNMDSFFHNMWNVQSHGTGTIINHLANWNNNNSGATSTLQQTYVETTSTMLQGLSTVLSSIAEWETIVLKSQSENESDKQIAFPTSMKTTLTNLTPEVKTYLEKALKEAVKAAWHEQFTTSSGDEELSFIDLLKQMLSNELKVNVTNDFINEVLQKLAFSNV